MANWDKIKSRGRVTDRRSQRTTGSIFGTGTRSAGSMSQMPINLSGMSGKTILIILAIMFIISLFSGSGDISETPTNSLDDSKVTSQSNVQKDDFNNADAYKLFAQQVVGSNNDMWEDIFKRNNLQYREPELILFRDLTNSGCGYASSETGPHYCPADEKIYLDETFFDEVLRRFGSDGGDVAEAYVIAHEVGHHAQNLLGHTKQLARAQSSGASNVNELSVELELQADCYAGLWANSIKDLGIFGPDEIEEALGAAAAVGDDRIQETTTGRVDPENWTHGSSEQRVQWFNTGYVGGDFNGCRV